MKIRNKRTCLYRLDSRDFKRDVDKLIRSTKKTFEDDDLLRMGYGSPSTRLHEGLKMMYPKEER